MEQQERTAHHEKRSAAETNIKEKMPEWKHITGNTGYVILDQSLIVTYDIDDRHTVLIDSGYSECGGLVKMLRERGRTVPAVLCTHFHVDHMGNNGLLQREFGSKIYASELDIQIQKIRYEKDEPITFKWMSKERYHFGDSGKFTSTAILPGQDHVTVLGKRFNVERLDGHSPDHLGFATPDGVLHIGDAFMSDIVLKKSKVPYEFDIEKTLKTLERIKHMDYKYFAAAHLAVIPEKKIKEIIDANIDYHLDMLDEIERRLNGWQLADKFIKEAIRNRGVNLRVTKSSGWLPLAVKSYIEYLIKEGRVICSRTPSESGRMDGLPDDPLDNRFYIRRIA